MADGLLMVVGDRDVDAQITDESKERINQKEKKNKI